MAYITASIVGQPAINATVTQASTISATVASGAGAPGVSLTTDQSISGVKTFNSNVYFKSGTPWVDVKAYGATGDGTTDDSTAIRAAIASLDTTLGGIIYFPPGTYMLSTLSTNSIFLPIVGKRVKLVGAGRDVTTIKVGNSVGNYTGIVVAVTDTTDISGLEAHYITFDHNHANNVPATDSSWYVGVTTGGGWVARRTTIALQKGSDIIISNNKFLNAPLQAISIDPRDTNLTNSQRIRIFDNLVQVNVTGTGDWDTTQMFLNGEDIIVTNNTTVSSNTNFYLSRIAYQAFGNRVVISNNTANGFYRSILAGTIGCKTATKSYTITGNSITNCNIGVVLFSSSRTGTLTSGLGLSNVMVANNTIHTNKPVYKRDSPETDTPQGIMYEGGANGDDDLSAQNITIANNLIYNEISTGDGVSSIEWNTHVNQVSAHKNIKIIGNTIMNPGGAGIGVACEIEGLTIQNNTIYDPGYNGILNTSYHSAIRLATGPITNLIVQGNQYIDSRGTHLIDQGLYLTGTAGTNIAIRNNQMRIADGTALPIVNIINDNMIPLLDETVDTHVAISKKTIFGSRIVEQSTGLTYLQTTAPNGTTWYTHEAGGVPYVSKTSNYTLTLADGVVVFDVTATSRTATLPTAVGIPGRMFTVKKIDSTVNTVTIDGNGSETIDGATTYTLSTQYQTVTIVSNGANWNII